MPVLELDESLHIMEEKGRELWPTFTMDRNIFCCWLGLWVAMCAEHLRDRKSSWNRPAVVNFNDIMSYEQHRRIQHVLEVVQYEDSDPAKLREVGEGEDQMRWIRRWLHACNRAWDEAYEAGTFITVDETMIF